MKKRKILKVICLIALLTSILFGQVGNQGIVLASTTYNLPSKTEDGAIFHAYNWTFSDIENTLVDIAAAGFNSIQVSPVQGTKRNTGEWWLLYQPCDYEIGNDQLGTYDEFKSLCSAADQYGIKIIVDVVLNHVADNGNDGQWDDAVADFLKNSELYHNQGSCEDYTDRWQVTQRNLGNLPDLATQRSDVQQWHIDFLNACTNAGADGFRFDAAKHMETNSGEDSGQSWSGDYWDNVLGNLENKDNLYLVGEVLPDTSDNDEVYRQYFDITAHGYGSTLRDAVNNKNLYDVLNINHGDHTISPDEALAYVENHDDYEHGASTSMGDWERKMAYAIIASRDELAVRYFARPFEDLWQDADIAAVNAFRNTMVGEGEYLRWTSAETILIERGSAGMVIVNLGDSTYIDSDTNLLDGSYSNHASSDSTLNVSNGKITGNVPGGSIVVLYDGDNTSTETVAWTPNEPTAGSDVTITYNSSGRPLENASSMNIHWGYDGFTGVTDTTMTSMGSNTWEVTLTVPSNASSTLDFVFTDGTNWDNNDSQDWSITISSAATETVSWTPSNPTAGSDITITYNSNGRSLENASSMQIHWGYDSWSGVTDTTMTSTGSNMWEVTLTVPSNASSTLDFVFTDGTNWDNNDSQDWSISIY